jgi:adenylate kinase family enzyme
MKRGRLDDQPETIKVRWQEFSRDTLPTVEHYRPTGNVQVVDGHGSPEEVNQRIAKVLHDAHLD